jgi:hypothetical protein
MNESRKPLDRFKVMMILLAMWVFLFAVTLVTEARTMARGVMPLISGALVLWAVYWTISLAFGGNKSVPEQSQPDADRNTNGKKKASKS